MGWSTLWEGSAKIITVPTPVYPWGAPTMTSSLPPADRTQGSACFTEGKESWGTPVWEEEDRGARAPLTPACFGMLIAKHLIKLLLQKLRLPGPRGQVSQIGGKPGYGVGQLPEGLDFQVWGIKAFLVKNKTKLCLARARPRQSLRRGTSWPGGRTVAPMEKGPWGWGWRWH